MTTTDAAPDGGMSLSGAECQWPTHWPAHGSPHDRGDCTRCAKEQEHAESHHDEPCPWEPLRDCEDCEQGKHQGCLIEVLDLETDKWVACPCIMRGHQAAL